MEEAARSRSAYGGGCKKKKCLYRRLQEVYVLLGGAARSRSTSGGYCISRSAYRGGCKK
jgi:hypothetical protein